MTGAELKLWIETIKTDKIVLTDGEYRLTFEVEDNAGGIENLPGIFREATIKDQFKVGVNSISSD